MVSVEEEDANFIVKVRLKTLTFLPELCLQLCCNKIGDRFGCSGHVTSPSLVYNFYLSALFLDVFVTVAEAKTSELTKRILMNVLTGSVAHTLNLYYSASIK